MKRRKKIIILGIIAIIGIGVCGCNMKKNTDNAKKSELVLNERQKEILEEAGLPTNPEELTSSQKRAIVAIDEMLCEVENKYNISFSYSGYIAPGPLENEQLIAYPTDGNEEEDSFTVTRTKVDGKYSYEDEYVNVVAKRRYMTYILEYCQTQLGEENVKVYSIVTKIKDKEMLLETEQIDFNVSGESCIFVDGAKITEDDYNCFMSNYKAWLEEHGIDDDTDFILLKEDVIEDVSSYSYTEYLASEYCLRRDFKEN